jgi:anti-sigma factor RsiW
MMNNPERGEKIMNGEQCDPERMAQLIVRYFFKDLRTSQRGKVEAHLSACPRCHGRYQALVAVYGSRESD